jgi:hypothetical protein
MSRTNRHDHRNHAWQTGSGSPYYNLKALWLYFAKGKSKPTQGVVTVSLNTRQTLPPTPSFQPTWREISTWSHHFLAPFLSNLNNKIGRAIVDIFYKGPNRDKGLPFFLILVRYGKETCSETEFVNV